MTRALRQNIDWKDFDWVRQYVHAVGGHDPTVIRNWPPRDLYDAYYDLRIHKMLGG